MITNVLLDGKEFGWTKLNLKRIALYKQLSFIEATDEHDYYYLIFYKEQFLTAKKTNKLRRQSFIEEAFKKGIVFLCPHPIVTELIQKDESLKMITFNQLYTICKESYSPQEVSLIFRALDSFISKEKLVRLIRKEFYQYRRDGKFLHAYQILWILKEFAPEHSWVKQSNQDHSFSKYEKMYQQPSEELVQKDPHYVYQKVWEERGHSKKQEILEKFLQKGRLTSTLTAYKLEEFKKNQTDSHYRLLLHYLNSTYPPEIILDIHTCLANELPKYLPIQQYQYNYFLKLKRFEEALQILVQSPALTIKNQDSLIGIVEEINWESSSIPLEDMSRIVIPLLKNQPEKLNQVLKSCIKALIQHHDVQYIEEWLMPLSEHKLKIPIAERIKEMGRLHEDPDQQSKLGEYYYQYQQLDRAIECFTWDMELKPNDPSPIKWLNRLYQEKGMTHESKAYQQLLIQMQKQA
ncbi:tetratricopeptide (TPR) repeat protein [Bacillus pakistanensis]|uniref:Tetratricopeptide (TPR) repeat protein n=1 Tax=Rossellomorea pakistanensis TaxID=992288 RepID=A0ABS2NBC9_9BACI|nr:hypothetical protein [Bacillus pakistanensis]MBM7585166.1 tetratricopeptide (TPR) repeat protein [Bacillus pakistanensis]